jgi:hypothetical protein
MQGVRDVRDVQACDSRTTSGVTPQASSPPDAMRNKVLKVTITLTAWVRGSRRSRLQSAGTVPAGQVDECWLAPSRSCPRIEGSLASFGRRARILSPGCATRTQLGACLRTLCVTLVLRIYGLCASAWRSRPASRQLADIVTAGVFVDAPLAARSGHLHVARLPRLARRRAVLVNRIKGPPPHGALPCCRWSQMLSLSRWP